MSRESLGAEEPVRIPVEVREDGSLLSPEHKVPLEE